MSGANYRNHGHYIESGWSAEPKETFKSLGALVAERISRPPERILDVGCATGELLGYLGTLYPAADLVGVDIEPALVAEAARLLPLARFARASALDLPGDLAGAFDLVCSIGCMSIFDETQIDTYWANIFGAVRPGGLAVVLSPLNEYGIDAMIRHRKRLPGRVPAWETGWNVYSVEAVAETVARLGARLETRRFRIPFPIERRDDPIRTWTIAAKGDPLQLTNGLKLLVDHYFMFVRKPD